MKWPHQPIWGVGFGKPFWLLVLNFHSVVLIDRSKWNEKRFLRFEFAEILSRKETSTLKAMAALLHRDSLSPDDGSPLLDTLDENSHKHAFEVSEDLKYSVREAIEQVRRARPRCAR